MRTASKSILFLLLSVLLAFGTEQRKLSLQRAVSSHPQDKDFAGPRRGLFELDWAILDSTDIAVVKFYGRDTDEWTMHISTRDGITGYTGPNNVAHKALTTELIEEIAKESIAQFKVRYPVAKLTLFAGDIRMFKDVWEDFCTQMRAEMLNNHVDSIAAFDLRLMSTDKRSPPREGEGSLLVTIGKKTNSSLQFRIFEVVGKRSIVRCELDLNEGELSAKAKEIARLKERLAPLWDAESLPLSTKRKIIEDVMLIADYVPMQDRSWLTETCERVLASEIGQSSLQCAFREHGLGFAEIRISSELPLIDPSQFPRGWGWEAAADVGELGFPKRFPFSILLAPKAIKVQEGTKCP